MEKHSSIASHQIRRIERFLRFDCPPSPKQPIDTILVLGTTKSVDSRAFDLRIDTALAYAKQYPTANIIVSGKSPDKRKKISQELKSDFVESAVMAAEIRRRGLHREIALEDRSTNTRENLLFSLNQIPEEQNVLIIGSSYMGRRVSFYLKKMRQDRLIPHQNWFIVDADVREDVVNLSRGKEEQTRKEYRIFYEWERLRRYRRIGHL